MEETLNDEMNQLFGVSSVRNEELLREFESSELIETIENIQSQRYEGFDTNHIRQILEVAPMTESTMSATIEPLDVYDRPIMRDDGDVARSVIRSESQYTYEPLTVEQLQRFAHDPMAPVMAPQEISYNDFFYIDDKVEDPLNIQNETSEIVIPKTEEEILNEYVNFFHESICLIHGDNCGVKRTDGKIFFILYYPEITITNSKGMSHLIKELYVVITFSEVGKYRYSMDSNLHGFRTVINSIEQSKRYVHSHLSGEGHFCLGSGPLSKLMRNGFEMELNKINIEDFELIILTIDSYVKWESLEGGPHNHITFLKQSSDNDILKSISDIDMSSITYNIDSFILKNIFDLKIINEVLEFLDINQINHIIKVKNINIKNYLCNRVGIRPDDKGLFHLSEDIIKSMIRYYSSSILSLFSFLGSDNKIYKINRNYNGTQSNSGFDVIKLKQWPYNKRLLPFNIKENVIDSESFRIEDVKTDNSKEIKTYEPIIDPYVSKSLTKIMTNVLINKIN